jgi:hypothetical protein
MVPLIFYYLHSNALDIYQVQKVKKYETIELERSIDASMVLREYTTINH